MTAADPHEHTPSADGEVCEYCGELLAERPSLAPWPAAGEAARRRRQLEHLAEVRRILRKDADR